MDPDPSLDLDSSQMYTECLSQERAKLRAFPRHWGPENTQPSPSLTPTLVTVVCDGGQSNHMETTNYMYHYF